MMFPAADYDHDERLTEEELTNWNNKQIRKFVEMNTKSMMRMIDANEDGKVTWHEFMRGMYGDKETRSKNITAFSPYSSRHIGYISLS